MNVMVTVKNRIKYMNKNLLIFIMLLSAVPLIATSFSGPVKQTVYSEDGKFCAVIDPDRKIQNVYKSSSMKNVYWLFEFTPELDLWFVSNNGSYVVCVRWRFVRADDLDKPAVIIFMQNGTRKDYSYNTLVKARKTGFFETAPRGSFWRVWYEDVRIEKNRVEIFASDKSRIVISGEDGAVNVYRD